MLSASKISNRPHIWCSTSFPCKLPGESYVKDRSVDQYNAGAFDQWSVGAVLSSLAAISLTHPKSQPQLWLWPGRAAKPTPCYAWFRYTCFLFSMIYLIRIPLYLFRYTRFPVPDQSVICENVYYPSLMVIKAGVSVLQPFDQSNCIKSFWLR